MPALTLSRHAVDDLYGATLVEALGATVTVLSGPEDGADVVPTDFYRRLTSTSGRTAGGSWPTCRATASTPSSTGGVDVLKVSDEELRRDGLLDRCGSVEAAMEHLVTSGAGFRHRQPGRRARVRAHRRRASSAPSARSWNRSRRGRRRLADRRRRRRARPRRHARRRAAARQRGRGARRARAAASAAAAATRSSGWPSGSRSSTRTAARRRHREGADHQRRRHRQRRHPRPGPGRRRRRPGHDDRRTELGQQRCGGLPHGRSSAMAGSILEERELPGSNSPARAAFAAEAAPAFIVRAANTGAFGAPPDIVLSGINRGPNTGHAVLHSGTVGAALTASTFGLPALAVSLDVRSSSARCHWETASAVARRRPALAARRRRRGRAQRQRAELPARRARRHPRDAPRRVRCRADDRHRAGRRLRKLAYDEIDADLEPGTDAAALAERLATVTSLRAVCEERDAGLPDAFHLDPG